MTPDIKTNPSQDVKSLVERLIERRKIMWNAPLKDGGFAKLVAPEDLDAAIAALSLPQAAGASLYAAYCKGRAWQEDVPWTLLDEPVQAVWERAAAALAHPQPAGDAPSQTDPDQALFNSINAKRSREDPPASPLTDAEKQTVRHMADDPFGGVYDPRQSVPPTDWSGNGYLNEYD